MIRKSAVARKTPKPGMFALALLVLAGACSTTINPRELLEAVPIGPRPEQPPPPTPDGVRPDPAGSPPRFSTEQVQPSHDGGPDGTHVSQIPVAPGAGADLRNVTGIDDPCVGDLEASERCRSSLAPVDAASAPASGDGLGLTIVAPDPGQIDGFDPERAADEIGRGRTLSQAAQSAGSEFLAGPRPPPADPGQGKTVVPDPTPIVVTPSPQ